LPFSSSSVVFIPVTSSSTDVKASADPEKNAVRKLPTAQSNNARLTS